MKKGNKFRLTALAMVFLFLLVFAMGCGVAKHSSVSNTVTEKVTATTFGSPVGMGSTDGTSFDAANSVVADKASVNSVPQRPAAVISNSTAKQYSPVDRKVILSGTMDIEANKFDKAVDGVTKLIQQSGGYVENSNISGNKSPEGNFLENRSANFVLRIPSSKFQYIMSSMGNFGTIINKTTSGEDVTYQYYDNEARLKTLKVKEERILDILKRTKVMQDVLAAESELQNTLYDIENLTSTQKKLENLVAYSSLTVTVREVYENKKLVKKPQTLGARVAYSFKTSVQLLVDISKGTLVAIVALLPFAIIIVIIFAIVWYFIKRRRKPENK